MLIWYYANYVIDFILFKCTEERVLRDELKFQDIEILDPFVGMLF